MKKKGRESEASQSSRTLINSSSKHTDEIEVKRHGTENRTSASMSSRGQAIELNVTPHEDGGPRKEDLKRIGELIDGFKASKVAHCVLQDDV